MYKNLDPLSVRVARRFLAGQIPILVDVPATLDVRKRFASHPAAILAEFAGSISLYRAFDGEELTRILRTGKITGGTYSAKAERAHGASWGENITAVIEFGNRLRDKRYGSDIFLAKLEAHGKRFYHLDPGNVSFDPEGPPMQATTMDRSTISVGLGASILDVWLHDVDLFVVHANHQIESLSLEAAKAYGDARPKKDVDLREVHPHLLQGSILGVDVRVLLDKGQWIVVLNNDKAIVAGAKSKEDAIELATMSIKINPANPFQIPPEVLERKRRYEKHFVPDDDPEKVRGSFALKPKDKVVVTKGSRALGIPSHSKATVADVYGRAGQREVMVKLLVQDKPVVLYATHANRLGDADISLMNSRGDRILVRRLT